MSSSENLRQQIADIEAKIARLNTQKSLLNDRLKRKEQHSSRIIQQNKNDQEAKAEATAFSISPDPRIARSSVFGS